MAFDLSTIKKGKNIQAPRMFIYGVEGIGKSSFGAGAPNPIFIRTEDGLGSIDTSSFPIAKSSADVLGAISTLYTEEHDYQTLVLDSADWLEAILRREMEAKYSDKDLGYGKDAIILSSLWGTVLDGLSALRNDKNMSIILIGHSQIKRFDSPETEPYDRYSPKLMERSSALLREWCDCVLFANYKTLIKKEEVGFNKTVSRGLATGERLLYTAETPAYLAKNRYNLPPSLPLNWNSFAEAIANSAA
jgi:hypothetical protein